MDFLFAGAGAVMAIAVIGLVLVCDKLGVRK